MLSKKYRRVPVPAKGKMNTMIPVLVMVPVPGIKVKAVSNSVAETTVSLAGRQLPV